MTLAATLCTYDSFNKTRSIDRPGKFSALGAVYADALLEAGLPDAYAARGIAKIFTIAGAPSRALDIISMVPAAEITHWLLNRRAEAELALTLSKALQTAQEGLTGHLLIQRQQRTSYRTSIC
jgi:hypothetical protein